MKTITCAFFCVSLSLFLNLLKAQNFPYPALVGYWEGWNNTLLLKDIDSNYNVIEVAFATTKGSSFYKMEFNYPWFYGSKNLFKADIETLQSQGRKVLLSIGGANDPVLLSNYLEKDTFITTMNTILDDYAFDGIDIDFENASLNFSNVTLENPTDSNLINIIDAIKQVLQHYQTSHGKRCFLTMAPEIIHVQGGIQSNSNGKFLPVIDALRNDLDLLGFLPVLRCFKFSMASKHMLFQGNWFTTWLTNWSRSIWLRLAALLPGFLRSILSRKTLNSVP